MKKRTVRKRGFKASKYKTKKSKAFKNKVARIATRVVFRQAEVMRRWCTLNNAIIDTDSQTTPSGGWQAVTPPTPGTNFAVGTNASINQSKYWTQDWLAVTQIPNRQGDKLRHMMTSVMIVFQLRVNGSWLTYLPQNLQQQIVRFTVLQPLPGASLVDLDAYIATIPADTEFLLNPNRCRVLKDKIFVLALQPAANSSKVLRWNYKPNRNLMYPADGTAVPLNDIRICFFTSNADYGGGAIQYVKMDGWMKHSFKDV